MENFTNFIWFPALPPVVATMPVSRRLNAREVARGKSLWNRHIAREFERSNEKLCSLARQYTRSNHCAEDLVADLFADALKWPLHKRRNIKNLGTYLMGAVRNRGINASKRKRWFAELDHSLLSDAGNIHSIEYHYDLEILLGGIPPRQADAFRLFLAGYSHEEIAEKMHLDSVGTSKTLVYRAKMKMKERLSHWTQPDPDDDGGGGRTVQPHKGSAEKFDNNNLLISEPLFEDILMFIERTLTNIESRQNITNWLLYDTRSIEIVAGLHKTIRNCYNNDVRLYFRTVKSALKEKLFGPADWEDAVWSSDWIEVCKDHDNTFCSIETKLYNRDKN